MKYFLIIADCLRKGPHIRLAYPLGNAELRIDSAQSAHTATVGPDAPPQVKDQPSERSYWRRPKSAKYREATNTST